MTDDTPIPGGQGGIAPGSGDLPSRSEVRLIERAITSGWGVTDDVKRQVVKRMVSIVDPDHLHEQPPFGLLVAGPRLAIAAARVLISADQADKQDRALDLRERQINRGEHDTAEKSGQDDDALREGLRLLREPEKD